MANSATTTMPKADLPDGTEVGDIPVWDGTAWVPQQPPPPVVLPPAEQIHERPYDPNPRPVDYLAIDAEDLGTRKSLTGDVLKNALPPGHAPGDVLTWDGSQWIPSQPAEPAAALSALTLDPTSIQGGSTSKGTVTLTGPAPDGGAVIALGSNNPTVANVPPSVTVAEGATSATFAITTTVVGTTTAVILNANYLSGNKTTTLTVLAQPVATKAIFWGRATVPRLTTEAEIEGLASTRQDNDFRGNAPIPEAGTPTYVFVAHPQTFGGPVSPNGFWIDPFPASMADPSIDDYGTLELNGYWADEVTVNGETYLVYRLYNQTSGGFTLITQ